jgi:putative ABC transport system substrate-binding protein
MRRRDVIAFFGAAAAWPLAAAAQQAGRVPRIGLLMPVSPDAAAPNIDAFRQGLRELGYAEGRNVAFEYRYTRGNDNLFAALAAELVRLKVDVILTWGTSAARAAKQATTTIPIVMGAIADPTGTGIVASLARPGGNITGLTSIAAEIEAKRLALLKELLPAASRIGVPWNPTNPASTVILQQLQSAAQALRLELVLVAVRTASDFPDAFASIARERPGALYVPTELLLLEQRSQILDFVASHRLPAVYGYREFADAGGLMFYGPSWPDLFRRAALYVDRILKGAKPSDLPVEQPTKFELILNLKAAKALDFAIPSSLLARADEVIE